MFHSVYSMMERQQVLQLQQEERLLRVRMETDSLEAAHQARGPPLDHRGCFRCMVAVTAIMGLVTVSLVVCFSLHYSMFMPSCKQVSKSW